LVRNYNEIKSMVLLMRTVIQYQTTFYNSVCMWKAARPGLKFQFLGAIVERLRKTTIGFLKSVPSVLPACLSLRRMEQGDFHWT